MGDVPPAPAAEEACKCTAKHEPASRKDSGLSITAVIPLYNGSAYIEQALTSVLAQQHPAEEILVVDDGSTDSGPEIVETIARHAPIKLLRKQNGGQSSARNLGIRHATGDLIALLDQDDMWYPDHLAELIQPFLEPRRRKLGWVYSNLDEVDERGQMMVHSLLRTLPFYHPKTDIFECLKFDMFVLPSSSLIVRSAFEAVGGFDETLSGYEDDDFFLRMFRAGFDNVFLDLPLTKWRIHTGSSSYSYRMAQSRRRYIEKLLREFPDNYQRGRIISRDCLVPRFFPLALSDYRLALRSGSPAQVRQAAEQLGFMARLHRPTVRVLISMVMPLLRTPMLGRWTLSMVLAMRPLARRVLR